MNCNENSVKRQIVLGAGASRNSKAESFPLGSDLKKIILELETIVSNKDSYKIINEDSQNNEAYFKERRPFCQKLQIFIENFKLSNLASIDSFIARTNDKNDYQEQKDSYGLDNISSDKFGCALITAIIRFYQEKNPIIEWYGEMIPLFFPPIKADDKYDQIKEKFTNHLKEIRVITFNYDISLEYFLYDFLVRNYFPNFVNSDENKKELFYLIQARIDHVYGAIYKKEDLFKVIEELRASNVDNPEPRNEIDKELYKILKGSEIFQESYHIWKNDDTGIKIMERGDDKIKVSKCDYLYVMGFAFDPINIKTIGLDNFRFDDKGKGWTKGCFLTNYGDNQKIKRIALNILAINSGQNDWLIPIISKFSIKEALEKDFSLMEESNSPEKIPSNQSLNGSSSPYFGLKKYEK